VKPQPTRILVCADMLVPLYTVNKFSNFCPVEIEEIPESNFAYNVFKCSHLHRMYAFAAYAKTDDTKYHRRR
jgi:hypothetical protein